MLRIPAEAFLKIEYWRWTNKT